MISETTTRTRVAMKWYTETYGAGWQNNVWGVIQFEGNWIRGD